MCIMMQPESLHRAVLCSSGLHGYHTNVHLTSAAMMDTAYGHQDTFTAQTIVLMPYTSYKKPSSV